MWETCERNFYFLLFKRTVYLNEIVTRGLTSSESACSYEFVFDWLHLQQGLHHSVISQNVKRFNKKILCFLSVHSIYKICSNKLSICFL
jgi:hypothetical protein